HVQDRIGREHMTLREARVASAAGVLPYLRKAQRRDFFGRYLERMQTIGYSWRKHAHHGELLRGLTEVGGLTAVLDDQREDYVRWLTLAYIGEPGGYGTMGRNRKVFYSNSAAPLVEQLLSESRDAARET